MKGHRARDRRVVTVTRAVVLVVLAAAALAIGSPARSAVDLTDGQSALPDLDVRTEAVPPTDAQLAAAQALGASVSWNKLGTPSSVYNLDGKLATGIQAPDAASAAQSWVAQNATLLGLDSTANLTLVKDTPLAGGAGHAVLLGQLFDGVLAAPDGLVTVATAGSAAGGWNISYASSTLARSDDVNGSYVLSPEQAWVQAAQAVGKDVTTADVTVAGTSDGWTELTVTGFAEPQSVRAAAFPLPGQAALPSYETVVSNGDVGYAQAVDASSGGILARENIVDNAVDDPVWKVFPAFPVTTPLNRFPWLYPSTDIRQNWCWTPISGCDFVVGTPANAGGVSMPWDQTLPAGPPTFTTSGNAAFDHEQWTIAMGAPVGFMPTSTTRDYVYPWTNAWFRSQCDPAQLTQPGVSNDIAAATANLFAMHSRMHDYSYWLGFTESAWNGQVNNFGTPPPFLGNDPVDGRAQSGALTGGFPTFNGRDNANMGTNRDGTRSVTNMFLWQPIAGSFYAPCVDGDYDMGVIGHEYGHMIENRMIGKGFRRAGNAAGAMGEAFGDLVAVEYLNENHFVPLFGLDPFVEGAYVTGNPFRGIRDYAMDWPMSGTFPTPGRNPHVNALNFGDFGFDFTGPEVHADGEIWVAVNYTLRQLFLNRYPSGGVGLDRACAAGTVPVGQCPGDRRWIQLYFDAMLLMPTAPTMVDARNAILAADENRFDGANQDILWRGFAERGFGQFSSQLGLPAATPPVTPQADTNPIPDFSSPDENNATVTFNAVAKDGHGTPVNAKVYVGDYEARVTPIADTDPANDPGGTAPTNLDNTAQFVPTADSRGDGHHDHGFRNNHGHDRDDDDHRSSGEDNGAGYNFVANAPGYGHVRFRIDDLRPGETRNVTIEFPTNLASTTNGATATGNGTNQQNLIDDTEGTNWGENGAPVEGQQVTIKLAGTAPVTFTAVNVSAMLVPGQNRFTALRQFRLDACTAGSSSSNPTCDGTIAAGWKTILVSKSDAFPAVNPRPVVPDVQLRSWDVPTTKATHVRFVVLNNQCTGQTSYQGEQDNDPTYSTDCRVTSLTSTGTVALPARNTQVNAAEVQILSSQPKIRGADDGKNDDHDH